MRLKIVGSLLIVGSGLGCYVQPYNPPPAQYGQVQQQPAPPPPQSQPQPESQPQPYAQQPGYDQQPGYPQQPGYTPPPAQQQPPVAQPAPPPVPPPSQPIYSGPSYNDVNVDVAGSNVPSVDVFYNDLAPYGSWYNDSTYGWVFAPSSTSYVPYSNGHWAYTDYGYTWVSADPFGWATDHYGRWVWANGWVWRPDTTWGPAWVQWRQGDGYVGWAPAGYTDDAYVPENAWRFVGAANLFSPDVRRSYVTANVGAYLRGATPVQRYWRHGNQTWVAGPDDDWLRRYRVQPRRERLDPFQFGRFNDQQRREAEQRARQHQGDWDARRRQDEQVRRDLLARQQREDEARMRQAEEQRRLTEEQRRGDDENRRLNDQRARAEADRARARSDAERQRAEAEQRRIAEQQQRVQAEQQRIQAEQQRRVQAEQQRQNEIRQRQEQELARRRAEDE